jgi:hypothetical protein
MFVDSTDGNTEETGLTIANTDIKLWKMGATSLANKNSGGGTHMANGVYSAVLDATDTNTLGALVIFVHVSGALPVKVECEVLAAVIYDAWIAGTDLFDVSVTQLAGSAISQSAGLINANVTQISGDATAADNLENTLDDTAGANRWTGIIDQGTAQSATGTTLRLRSAAAFADDELNGCWIVITGGSAGVGQVRRITDYVSSTDTATVDTWTTTPTGTITYQVRPAPPIIDVNVAQFGGAAGTFASGRPEVNTTLIEGSDATNQIRDAVVDDATRIDASALNTLSSHDPGETIMGATDLGTGAGLTSLATAAALATVDGIVDAILVDTAEIGAAGAGLTALASQASVNTVDTVVDAIKVVTDKLDTTLEATSDGYHFTENALEMAPGGGSAPTVEQIADEVETRTIAGVTTVGTVNALAANSVTASALAADAVTEIQSGLATSAALATVDTVVDGIKVTTDKVDNTLENTSDGWIFTVNGLQNAPSGTGASASDIADEVQTRTIAAVTTVNGLAANVITAAATAADFTTEIQSGLATAAALATVDTVVDAIKVTTDKLDGMVENTSDGWIWTLAALQNAPSGSGLDAAGVRAAIGLASANLDSQLDALPTAAENTSAVWGAGARTLTAIDEDSTTLDLDATIRAAVGLAAANLDTQIDAVPTAVENADALLDRNMASGADNGSTTVRTPRQALRILRNKWSIDSDGEQTIMKEDDATPSWTQQLATDGSAQPVTGTDPAGP